MYTINRTKTNIKARKVRLQHSPTYLISSTDLLELLCCSWLLVNIRVVLKRMTIDKARVKQVKQALLLP